MCLFQLERLVHLGKTNKQTKNNAKLQDESILQAPSLKLCPILQFYHFMKVISLHMDFVVLMSFNHHSCSTTANAEGKQAS